jgi:DNA-directed RNA polymerase subunit beta'
MGRNMVVAIVDERRQGTRDAPRHLRRALLVDEGDKVKRGQRIAEWDPYTRPILTEVDGIVASRIWSKACRSESTDESTGITKRVVIDWRSTRAARTCKPAIVIKDARAARS